MGASKQHKKAEQRVERAAKKLDKHRQKVVKAEKRLMKAQRKLRNIDLVLPGERQSRGADVEELRAGAAGSSGLVQHEQRDIPGPPDPVLHPDDTPIG